MESMNNVGDGLPSVNLLNTKYDNITNIAKQMMINILLIIN